MSKLSKPGVLADCEPYAARWDWPKALALLKDRLAERESDLEAVVRYLASITRKRGHGTPFSTLDNASTGYPGPSQTATQEGFRALLRGDSAGAVGAFQSALACEPTLDVYIPLALAMLPGPNYIEHLDFLQESLVPRTYLEIGVETGNSLRLVREGTQAIGIDPYPQLREPSRPNTIIYRVKSNFFFDRLASCVMVKRPISLAFIDGLHRFEQVLLDIVNTERYCGEGSIVVLHDTLPVAEAPSTRVRRSPYWCGDVWKVVACLEYYRPDLRILTLPSFPSGLTLLIGLDPTNSVLQSSFDRAVRGFAGQPFSDCEARLARVRAAVPNTIATTAQAIGLRDEMVSQRQGETWRRKSSMLCSRRTVSS
jgi:hypothetical protein